MNAPTEHRGPALIALAGPTASGKTDVSLALAERFGAHILNYDSVQLYAHLEIGSAKPTAEERARAPHHFYEYGSPAFEPTAGDYAKDAAALIGELLDKGERIVLVGGTGLYLRALVYGLAGAPPSKPEVRARILESYKDAGPEELHAALARVDPAAAERLPEKDRQRILRALEVYEQTGKPLSAWQEEHGFAAPRFDVRVLGLDVPRERLYERIEWRSAKMITQGLVGEVERLLAMGYKPEGRALSAIGYRHVLEFLAGGIDEARLIETLARDTRRYAKRQLTWWRGDEAVRWLPALDGPDAFLDAAAEIWGGEGEQAAR